jgi:hypothetical protein
LAQINFSAPPVVVQIRTRKEEIKMNQLNDRTEHSPQDPRFRVPADAPRTDYDRSGEGAEARRRAQLPAEPTVPADTRLVVNSLGGLMETAVAVPKNEVAALAYNAGISHILAARVVALERQVAALIEKLEKAGLNLQNKKP